MQDAGVDFQSHSWAHHDLTQLTEDECVRDLRDSRELLSDLLGRPGRRCWPIRGAGTARTSAGRRPGPGSRTPSRCRSRHEEVDDYAIPRVGIFRGNGQLALRIKAARPYLRLRHSERIDPAAPSGCSGWPAGPAAAG